ncbi:hypothetical protein SISSUDRAFT_1054480 [Sistotremastrum suecicum HHB10207 ss-3]|uniref:Uncharacterized protein n=1 Tax=Sistotremastrum suecicum HHB10207 ss-3 TaxID=1314776 RepID=A0A165YGK7_9AGAM|nr:hypothetical protein SISSUDRAFT_1054480 [Sistotremastrum suecicum HHB10207 ss-3]
MNSAECPHCSLLASISDKFDGAISNAQSIPHFLLLLLLSIYNRFKASLCRCYDLIEQTPTAPSRLTKPAAFSTFSPTNDLRAPTPEPTTERWKWTTILLSVATGKLSGDYLFAVHLRKHCGF